MTSCSLERGEGRLAEAAQTVSDVLRNVFSCGSFKTGNEIDRQEEGALKDVRVKNEDGLEEVKRVNVVRGIIRYPKPDGTFYELR